MQLLEFEYKITSYFLHMYENILGKNQFRDY